MRRYIGLVHKEPGSDYGVSFPDFPGLVTAGRTLDEALHLAEDALQFHIEGMRADGELIPMPTSADALMKDAANHGAIVTYVPADESIAVPFPGDVLAAIDRHAERHGMTRSDFIADAAKRAAETEDA